MKQKIKVGVEIEGVINTQHHKIICGQYHDGLTIKGLKNWIAEKDGSLNTNYSFNFPQTIEFVSCAYSSLKDLRKGLKAFKKKLSKNNTLELNKVIVFNESCGTHLHLSLNTHFKFNQKVLYEIYKEVRNYFFKEIEKSNIQSKQDILKHYNRRYAKLLTKKDFKNRIPLGTRQVEFNLYSEIERKGLEWRGLNMLNIKTWAEFFEFWDIVINSVKLLIKKSQKYHIKHKTELLTQTKIKEILNSIYKSQEIKINEINDLSDEKNTSIKISEDIY